MSEQARPRIAVVMLTWNQREITLRALRSLGEAATAELGVVLWDNGSTDGTLEAVQAEFPQVVTHRHPENLGVASGRNAAARLALQTLEPRYLLFLDNDLVLRPGFADALLKPFGADPRLAQTQAKLLFLDDPDRINYGGGSDLRFWLGRTRPVGYGERDRGQYDTPSRCVACGGAMLIRADLFEAIGGFDPIFDPFGPEDLDLSLRLRQRGYHALYVPAAVALHAANHSFGADAYSAEYARYRARHWLTFLRRHAPLHQRLAFYVGAAPARMLRILAREGAKGNLGAVLGILRGARDAASGTSATAPERS